MTEVIWINDFYVRKDYVKCWVLLVKFYPLSLLMENGVSLNVRSHPLSTYLVFNVDLSVYNPTTLAHSSCVLMQTLYWRQDTVSPLPPYVNFWGPREFHQHIPLRNLIEVFTRRVLRLYSISKRVRKEGMDVLHFYERRRISSIFCTYTKPSTFYVFYYLVSPTQIYDGHRELSTH